MVLAPEAVLEGAQQAPFMHRPLAHLGGMLQRGQRQQSMETLAALLRCGALPALSRLLAAEEHRGSRALLDTGTLLHAVQPVAQMVHLCHERPQDLVLFNCRCAGGQRLSIVRALAESSLSGAHVRLRHAAPYGPQAAAGLAPICTGSGSVPVFRIIMISAAILAACQYLFGQNSDRIRIFKRVFPKDLPRNPEKCTIVRISRPERHRNYERSEFFAK